jgi:hypothetical protein
MSATKEVLICRATRVVAVLAQNLDQELAVAEKVLPVMVVREADRAVAERVSSFREREGRCVALPLLFNN